MGAVESREKWRKLVVKSSVVPKPHPRLRDRWRWMNFVLPLVTCVTSLFLRLNAEVCPEPGEISRVQPFFLLIYDRWIDHAFSDHTLRKKYRSGLSDSFGQLIPNKTKNDHDYLKKQCPPSPFRQLHVDFRCYSEDYLLHFPSFTSSSLSPLAPNHSKNRLLTFLLVFLCC